MRYQDYPKRYLHIVGAFAAGGVVTNLHPDTDINVPVSAVAPVHLPMAGGTSEAKASKVLLHGKKIKFGKIDRKIISQIKKKKLIFMKAFVGRPVNAITLNSVHTSPDGDFTEALTDNFLKLRVPGRHEANHWIRAQAEQVRDGMLVCRGCECLFPGPTMQGKKAVTMVRTGFREIRLEWKL